ncbi:MAG TPA: hypothetical protein VN736_28870 [Candidatus Limnocylindrales bacterium]|nr:hypothetical protein [Candidatus Limnocylindrales bacterium]
MNIQKEIETGRQGEACSAVAEVVGTTESPAPRKLTFAENAILTIKVLVGFGLLGAALWGITLWKAVE